MYLGSQNGYIAKTTREYVHRAKSSGSVRVDRKSCRVFERVWGKEVT